MTLRMEDATMENTFDDIDLARRIEVLERELRDAEEKIAELTRENLNLAADLRIARDLKEERDRTISELMADRVKLAKEVARLKGEGE